MEFGAKQKGGTLTPPFRPPQGMDLSKFLFTEKCTRHYPMNPESLSSTLSENLTISPNSDRFYRLTHAEVIDFRESRMKPAEIATYCYIKTVDPFGQGCRILPKQIGKDLNYHPRTISRAIKALNQAGKLALAFVEAHVKLVATAVETIPEIVSKLGSGGLEAPTPASTPEPQSVRAASPLGNPIPTPTAPTKGLTAIADIVPQPPVNVEESKEIPTNQPSTFPEDKTPQWMAQIERQLELLGIQLSDVLHALKKYPIKAIEDALAHTKKQTWATAKAGVFVNFLKKWQPTSNQNPSTAPSKVPSPKSESQPVTALMKRHPEVAQTLSLEQNPIDEATLDYLLGLEAAGAIHGTTYSTIHNYFGVFITKRDYPHAIPWWEAIKLISIL
jgi:hypothetical protein